MLRCGSCDNVAFGKCVIVIMQVQVYVLEKMINVLVTILIIFVLTIVIMISTITVISFIPHEYHHYHVLFLIHHLTILSHSL